MGTNPASQPLPAFSSGIHQAIRGVATAGPTSVSPQGVLTPLIRLTLTNKLGFRRTWALTKLNVLSMLSHGVTDTNPSAYA